MDEARNVSAQVSVCTVATAPDQALAIIELLDDLLDRIWAHYELALVTRLRDERLSHRKFEIDDPPF